LKIRICFGFRYSNFEFFNSPAKAGFGSGYAGLGSIKFFTPKYKLLRQWNS